MCTVDYNLRYRSTFSNHAYLRYVQRSATNYIVIKCLQKRSLTLHSFKMFIYKIVFE